MNNNNTDLFKILLLSEYDIDYEKSSSVILEGGFYYWSAFNLINKVTWMPILLFT